MTPSWGWVAEFWLNSDDDINCPLPGRHTFLHAE